jgi:hypothetical protein|tara:strand:+ start:925 stop:2877 length:1953 start_codon:yes stop_codon:yes gene_type:complete
MNSKKKNIESQIVEDFEKIRPAITRLLQSQMNNENISIRYGRSKSSSKDDIVINPSVLVGTISQSTLKKDEVLIGTVVHEAIHSMSNYKVDMSLISEYFEEDFNDVDDISDVLEIMTGPFGQYIFDILIHSIEEKVFVNEFGGLNSILKDIYKESFHKTKSLTAFSQFLSLLFHSITLYINPEYKDFKKNVTEALNESLHLLKPLNYKEVNISEVLEASIQMVDICRRYNILPDLDKYNLGEQKEISQSLDETVVNELSKVLIPSSNNLTTGNTLQKFIGKEVDTQKDEKLNLMDDHISKVGASSTIYFPSGYTSKIVSSKLPDNFKNLYQSGSITYENLLTMWNLPVFKVTNKIKPYFIHNQKRQRISGFDQGDLSPHVPIMLASGRYERMFEQKQRLSNKSYALSLLIDGSGSMIEKSNNESKPWSLSAALIGASYLAQICFELNIDFEVSIFNRGFAADLKETDSEYIKRKFAISSMLNTTYGSSAQEIFNTTNHYFVKEFNDSWRDNYEKFIGLIEFSRNLRSSIDSSLDENLIPPFSMFEKGTNVDEVNIMHASKRLLNHPSNTKLLVVLSDGMTRGSIPELKNSINFASKNKISVIGVGIGNRGSWKEYENNVQVQHPEQLIYSIVNITKDILIKNIKTTTGAA